MAIIERKILLSGPLAVKEVTALFDSGASMSCIRPEIAKELEQPIPLRQPLSITTADRNNHLQVNEAVMLEFYIDDYRFYTEFFLVPNLSEEVIIGATTMQQWRFKLDFDKEEVIIDPRVTRMRI
ncbi:retroviral-like aspartic protease [bacterium]|nr:retroviral-like aspartic protease [FCB group bacterium]MBL7191163.1 retroviral-like aspartic protease [bacterium]